MTSLGPYWDEFGITSDSILERLPQFENLSNGQVYELTRFVKSNKLPWRDIRGHDMSTGDMTDQEFCPIMARLKVKRDKIKVSKDPLKLEDFYRSAFTLPIKSGPRKSTPPLDSNISTIKKPCMDQLVEEVTEMTKAGLLQDLADCNKRCLQFEKDNHQLIKENNKLKQMNDELKEKLRKCNVKRVNQRIKRLQLSADSWKCKFQRLAATSKSAQKMQKQLKESQRAKNLLHQAKQQQKRRFMKRNQELKAKNINHNLDSKVIKTFHQQLNTEKNNSMCLENELEMAKEQIQNHDMDHEMATKSDGKTYRSEIREASYHLAAGGVAQKKISYTLKKIHKSLTGQDLAGDLPSYATQNYMAKELKSLSRQQVREGLEGATETTIKYDGTTKQIGHLVEVEVSTKNQNYLLAVKGQVGGKAVAYMDTIKKSVSTFDEPNTPSILNNITNVMSDRCATNKAVEDLLEKEKGSKLNRFKCGLHPLDTIAKECEKGVNEFEVETNFVNKRPKGNYPFTHRSESHTQALIRTTGKLFHDTAYSCHHEIASYLTTENHPNVTYHRYVGNRFHVMFLNSGILYHLTPHLSHFFTNIYRPNNLVQSAVANGLQCKDILVPLRALGLVGKVITGPWMRLVGQVDNILALNPYFDEAAQKLQVWSLDASPLLSPEITSIFSGTPIINDPIFNSLTTPQTNDLATSQLLTRLCQRILSVVQRQLPAQLPGGEFWDPDEHLRASAESCAATNISGERVFARCDREMARAPGAQLGFVESKVLFNSNKTAEWLMEKDAMDRRKHIQAAMREARTIRTEEIDEQKRRKEKIDDMLKQKRKEQLQKEDKEREKLEKTLEEMYECGGLWERENISQNLGNLKSKTKKIHGLKVQIQIRCKVLKCETQNKIRMTKPTVDQLEQHLNELCQSGVPAELSDLHEVITDPRSLIGMHFTQQWSTEGRVTWCDGTVTEECASEGSDPEFKIMYGEDEVIYMTASELIADIVRGDLDIVQ